MDKIKKTMFSTLAKSTFAVFADANGFSDKVVDDTYILLSSLDFDIIVSYDQRENEVSVDFDLSRYSIPKKHLEEMQFPVLLNINSVSKYLGISVSDFMDDRHLSLEERVRLKLLHLEAIWNRIGQNQSTKDVLSSMLMDDRIQFRKEVEQQHLKRTVAKAHSCFKAHEYEKTIDLLKGHREQLSEYDRKILEYSLKRIGL